MIPLLKILKFVCFFSWWIPISFATSKEGFSDTQPKIWMSPKEQTKILILNETLDPEFPLIVNVQQTGFYRYFCS